MRGLLIGASLALLAGAAQAASDPNAPAGKLPDVARPAAYRLDFTILPDQPGFSGHTEIDVVLTKPVRSLYLHGKDLKVAKAAVRAGGRTTSATWTEVDPTGVVRLDFATPVPAGQATLSFDYAGVFRDSPSGMYHIKVGEQWYSWTQFESTDARAAYPSFDEPGFKTPFTVSVTTKPGYVVVTNTRETAVAPAGALETHRFEPTKPLPTYLVAIDTGPFLHPTSQVPPTPQRAVPLPLGAVATRAQAGKLDYVLAETPRIVSLLESYFGQPFPFPKLDQVASPEMPGAMENAGADTYADDIILLDEAAPTARKQTFGMVVAHELAHQWFGDLVTPAWWDDIWLNESLANWMGYRIGNEWRPELKIGVGAIREALRAMDTDGLEVGRPIHQPIATNAEIDSAFDEITYGKGGQVIAMIAAFMGDDQFKAGVRLHLSRHMYGNATTDQFFGALADAAHDPRILTSMRSFVDQPGVPLVTFTRTAQGLTATQSPYAFLGGKPRATQWTIPLCLSGEGGARSCTLLDKPSAVVSAPAGSYLMPNAGGTGYYRFELPEADWRALIAAMPGLPPGEALAADDSLWASFRAGRAPAADLIAEAKASVANPDATVSVSPGQRLAGLRLRGMIEGPALEDYRRLMATLYAPKLAAMGFDPAAGVYRQEAPDRQKLRQSLVGLVAEEARDPAVHARLAAAARAYLGGDAKALDQAFMEQGFLAYVQDGGQPAAALLADKALASEDATFRGSALSALAASGRQDVAKWVIGFQDKRLRPSERIDMLSALATTAETRDLGGDQLIADYDQLTKGANGIFFVSRVTGSLAAQCSVEKAAQIQQALEPKVRASGSGLLGFQRTVERIRHCGVLKQTREGELAKAIKAG